MSSCVDFCIPKWRFTGQFESIVVFDFRSVEMEAWVPAVMVQGIINIGQL